MPATTAIDHATLPAWKQLDHRLFRWIGGGHAARGWTLALARVTARWSWVPLLALMGAVVLRDGVQGWGVLAQCLLVCTVVQVASKRLARLGQAARPFMVGLSPNHLGHSERGGFPSTHATVMGSVLGFMALPLLGHPALAGMAAVVLATGWARVYAGAHFPLDVLAGLLLGTGSGALLALGLGP